MRDKIVRNISKTPLIGVYLIRNEINNKCYIGHSIDIERRWNQHKYGKGSKLLFNALKKYGINNFAFNIVEKIHKPNLDKKELESLLVELEQKWFDKEKPFINENGYNIQKDSKPNIPIKRPEGYGELISKIKIEMNHCGKPVKQYTKSGELIKEWKSAAEVERELEYHAENISACCLGKQKTCKGFIWKFSDVVLTDEILNELNTKNYKFKKVNMLTIDGELIREFDSMREAANHVDCPTYQISKVCSGKQNTCRGYKWEFKNE